jgi:glycosyltransferase involved in cell wall biosynthesis
MKLLVSIQSIQPWQESMKKSCERPRLALPYAFATAFYNRNHQLFAIEDSKVKDRTAATRPFEYIYQQHELLKAMRNVDLTMLGGGGDYGISAILRQMLNQILLSPPRYRVLFVAYVWQLSTLPTLKKKVAGMAVRFLARFSRAVIVMTDEQLVLAKQMLTSRIPVIRFICGIDTYFYKIKSNYSDIPETHRSSIDKLLTKPYAIMLGDQQRCNNDALELIKHCDIQLVRVLRGKKTSVWFNEEIQKHGFNDRLFIFEDISYIFLRFLLQHASAYVGLVDSSWQPAGWTVACEALSSGLPIILYDGLVSREIRRMGADNRIMRSVPYGDILAFQAELESVISQDLSTISKLSKDFASNNLDIENTSRHFVKQVESLCS